MSQVYGVNTVVDGLVLCLDAGNHRSYPGSGTSWTDVSGNENTGTLTNGPTFDSGNNGSISFDGVDDYVSLPLIHTFLTDNNVFTAECWFNISNTTTTSIIWGQVNINGLGDDGELFEFAANRTTGSLEFIWSTTVPQLIAYSSTISANTWYQVVGVKNGAVASLYLNGELDQTITNASNIAGTTGAHNIGKPSTDVRHFSGKVALTRFYNRALSATEVAQNYNATKTRFGL